MEVVLEMPFEQLVSIVKQLTPSQKAKLKKELLNDISPKQKEHSSLTELLLSGPVFSDKQIETIENTRKSINTWRTKG